jgi:hypothetical protein
MTDSLNLRSWKKEKSKQEREQRRASKSRGEKERLATGEQWSCLMYQVVELTRMRCVLDIDHDAFVMLERQS